VNDARQAIKEEAPLDRLRSLTGELQQLYHGLAAAGAASAEAGAGAAPGSGRGPGDDVIDAEFTPSDE
jgi:molecular chaperone DnaK